MFIAIGRSSASSARPAIMPRPDSKCGTTRRWISSPSKSRRTSWMLKLDGSNQAISAAWPSRVRASGVRASALSSVSGGSSTGPKGSPVASKR